MYNILVDSDALVKLVHSGVLYKICEVFNCLITKEVKEETVKEGKERLYPDAMIIDELIQNKFIGIKEPEKKLKYPEKFGKGEKSILNLYHSTKDSTIISDDSKFIKYLEKESIQFLIPSDLIVLLKRLDLINLKEATDFLNKMKVFIKEQVYKETKNELREEIK